MKKLAVIGYGGMGAWHVKNALQSDVVTLCGIYDANPDKIQQARQDGLNTFSSIDEIINDKSIDIVTVTIPNELHLPVVVKLLEGGKNVICEKPVAMSSEELEQMISASNKSGALFTAHQNRRWDADYLAIQSLVDSGEIGAPFRIESRIHGSRGIPCDWRGKKANGGGMIYDWGIHLVDQMMCLFKNEKIDTVNCITTHITNKEVDDGFFLTLTFESGKTALVEVGTYNFIPMPRFYAQFEKGTAMTADWREKTKVARCKCWQEKEILPINTAAGLTKTMAPRDSVTLDEYELEIPESDVHDFYRNFAKAIDGQAVQAVTHDQMRLDVKIIEHAFKSAECGQTVKFQY